MVVKHAGPQAFANVYSLSHWYEEGFLTCSMMKPLSLDPKPEILREGKGKVLGVVTNSSVFSWLCITIYSSGMFFFFPGMSVHPDVLLPLDLRIRATKILNSIQSTDSGIFTELSRMTTVHIKRDWKKKREKKKVNLPNMKRRTIKKKKRKVLFGFSECTVVLYPALPNVFGHARLW